MYRHTIHTYFHIYIATYVSGADPYIYIYIYSYTTGIYTPPPINVYSV